MLDVSISYNRYKFLGHEFLTWLWFIMEEDQDRFHHIEKELIFLTIDNRIVLENTRHEAVERIIINGDEADLEEGKLCLRKGGLVTELNFSCKSGNIGFKFNLKGESLTLSAIKVSETGAIEQEEDLDGAVLEKIFLCEKVVHLIETLYFQFVKLRLSTSWHKTIVPLVKKWISV